MFSSLYAADFPEQMGVLSDTTKQASTGAYAGYPPKGMYFGRSFSQCFRSELAKLAPDSTGSELPDETNCLDG